MKTLGQFLKDHRTANRISLDTAAEQTHIRKIYLQNLEESNYAAFPNPLQIKGFISIYARYLNIEPEDALAFYRREQPQLQKSEPFRFKLPALKKPAVLITSQLIVTFAIIMMVTTAAGYIVWQYIKFAGAPTLEIFSPRDGLVTTTNTLKVEGVVSDESRLTLNNTTIRVSNEGYFIQDIPLSEGINVLTFVAVNTSGKSTTIKRIVRYDEK